MKDHFYPIDPALEDVVVVQRKEGLSTASVIGYIFAVLLPFLGLLIGLALINRSRHGIWIVVVSTIAFFSYCALVFGAGA